MSNNDLQTAPHEQREITSDSPLTLPGFFEAMAEERLLAGKCSDCGKRLIPPRPACYECGSRDIEIEEQPMTGEVVSYTEVYRPPPAFADLAPFAIATVELDSGARLTGRMTVPYDDVNIGMPIQIRIRQPEDISADTSLRQEQDWPLHLIDPA